MKRIIVSPFVCLLLLLASCITFAQQPLESNMVPTVKAAFLPRYPLLPSGAREPGEVTVSINLDSMGNVVSTASSGASDALRGAAETAAIKWKFGDAPRKVSLAFAFTLVDKTDTGCLPSITFGNPIRIEVCEQRKAVVVISDPPLVDLSKPIEHK
jgi:hypothetical protein